MNTHTHTPTYTIITRPQIHLHAKNARNYNALSSSAIIIRTNHNILSTTFATSATTRPQSQYIINNDCAAADKRETSEIFEFETSSEKNQKTSIKNNNGIDEDYNKRVRLVRMYKKHKTKLNVEQYELKGTDNMNKTTKTNEIIICDINPK